MLAINKLLGKEFSLYGHTYFKVSILIMRIMIISI